MKQIRLINSSKVALVDDEDYDRLNQFKWRLHTGYAAKGHSNYGDFEFMHNLLIPKKDGFDPDHINRDSLDNRKENLRYLTRTQNSMNRGLNKNNTSGYKGVSFSCRGYIVHISVNGKTKHIGRFANIHDAARAYNEAAKRFHGEHAFLNVIEEQELCPNPTH